MKSCVSDMIANHANTMLLLIDIGAFGFQNFMEKYPDRVKNIGIFEDGIVGVSAGLALSGLIPTVYGITPFIVQRSLEQLKLDYIYQNVGGNFITTGAAYDFSKLGYSHYCPEDVETLNILDAAIDVCRDLDVTLLYYTTAEPFDLETLRYNIENNRIFICEPFYQGTFMKDILPVLSEGRVAVDGVGVPRQVMRTYGTKQDKDMNLGLTAHNIRNKLVCFLEREL